MVFFFFFNDPATTEIYTLSLHDALPICVSARGSGGTGEPPRRRDRQRAGDRPPLAGLPVYSPRTPAGRRRLAERRSEEHTSELQSRQYLVCRLLLEKKKKKIVKT